MTYELTPRQKAILAYLIEHPDSTIKERIIENLTKAGKGSRKTILRDIRTLEDLGVIYIDKEKPNSQVHYVRIRNDNVLLSVMDELATLKDAFSVLIDDAKQTFDYFYRNIGVIIASKKYRLEDAQLAVVHAQISLQILFQHFIGLYFLYSIFVWPREVADKKTRDRLHTMLFETIREIQIKLADVHYPHVENHKDFRGLDQQFVNSEIIDDSFILKEDKLHKTIIDLEYIGLGEQGEAVLDLLWKFGFRFVPDGYFHIYLWGDSKKKEILNLHLDKVRDWRYIVKEYVEDLPPDEKKWSRAVSNKY
jgi:DNA-binding transcriptional ArsR family regulator